MAVEDIGASFHTYPLPSSRLFRLRGNPNGTCVTPPATTGGKGSRLAAFLAGEDKCWSVPLRPPFAVDAYGVRGVDDRLIAVV